MLGWLGLPFAIGERAAVTGGRELRDLFGPDERRVLDPQRLEHFLVAELNQFLAGQFLDDLAEVDEPFAGIGKLSSRGELDVELSGPPVREPGAVSQHHPRGDELVAVVVGDIFVREIGVERRVELQDAAIDEPEDGVGADGLGHRGGLEDRVVSHWLLGRACS